MNIELPISTERATKIPHSVTRAALAEAVQRRSEYQASDPSTWWTWC